MLNSIVLLTLSPCVWNKLHYPCVSALTLVRDSVSHVFSLTHKASVTILRLLNIFIAITFTSAFAVLSAWIAQSVRRLAMGWTVRGSNCGKGEIFRTPPSFLYNRYWVPFQGVNRPGRGFDHPSPSSAEVEKRVEL